MKRLKIHQLLIIILGLVMSSCLTTEKKEYVFKFTGTNSGTLTIRYINLMSSSDDSTDISKDDFQDLLNKKILVAFDELLTFIDRDQCFASDAAR